MYTCHVDQELQQHEETHVYAFGTFDEIAHSCIHELLKYNY